MTSLVCAAVFFAGLRVGVAGTRLRDRIVARVGEQGYLGLFSLASFVGLLWFVTAYADAPYVPLWGPLPALRPVAIPLVFVAFLFVVVGLTTPSPTVVGGDKVLEADEPATGIQRVTRHPFLWGVALWAFVHLVVNGHARGLVLFGTMLFLGVFGPVSIDSKRRRRLGAAWGRYEVATSNVPFAAILQGRNRFVWSEIGWGRVGFAAIVFGVFLVVHPMVVGGYPLGFLAR